VLQQPINKQFSNITFYLIAVSSALQCARGGSDRELQFESEGFYISKQTSSVYLSFPDNGHCCDGYGISVAGEQQLKSARLAVPDRLPVKEFDLCNALQPKNDIYRA
jgi:hypothetical protein